MRIRYIVAVVLAMVALPSSALGSPVATWGYNAAGMLGDGHTSAEQLFSDVPVQVSGITEAVQVAGQCFTDAALLSNGTVKTWGSGEYGALGNNSTESSDMPVTVSGLSGVTQIAAGCHFFLARKSDGTVWGWGENGGGPGSLTTSHPVEMLTATGSGHIENAIAVAATGEANGLSGEAGFALLSTGHVLSWGSDRYFELGHPTTGSFDPYAEEVQGISGAVAVSAGDTFGIALINNGTVRVWGNGAYGQWGNGQTSTFAACSECTWDEPPTPATVSNLSSPVAISASGEHALALLSNGTVRAWGSNSEGELGNGSLSEYADLPTTVSGLSTVAAIAASPNHNVAVLENGGVRSWGSNRFGELGDGNSKQPYSDVPVEVGGLLSRPQIGTGALLASAPTAEVISASGWAAHLSLMDAKTGESFLFSGSFSGYAAKHGNVSPDSFELTPATQTMNLFGIVPVTLGTTLSGRYSLTLHISSVGLFGLEIPTNCNAGVPSVPWENPTEVGPNSVHVGNANQTLERFTCQGGFLGSLFGDVLTELLSGAGNTLSLTLEP